MKFKTEFSIYVSIYILVFYGLWFTVYRASHNSDNQKKLVSWRLVEKPQFMPFENSFSKNTMEDVAVYDEWNSLLRFIVYSAGLIIYLPICLLGSFFSRNVHKIFRIFSSAFVLTFLCGSFISLDIFLMTTMFFSLGRLLRGYPIFIWAIGILAMHYSNDFLDKTVFRQLFTFDRTIVQIIFPAVYSTHFMSLVRSISLALFLCDVPSSKSTKTEQEKETDEGNTTFTAKVDHQIQMEPQTPLWERFLDALDYAFYPPTIFYGPLVIYPDWNSFINKKIPTRFVKSLGRFRKLTVAQLVGRGLRLFSAAAFWSLLVCILYPKAIMSYPKYVNFSPSSVDQNPWNARGFHVPSWTVWTSLFLAGIGFYFYHLILYGLPGLVADAEQLATETVHKWRRSEKESDNKQDGLSLCLVPAPPSCVFRITLYSEMWRTFDRGLYNFMFCHIYLPLREDRTNPEKYSSRNSVIRLLRQILASILPFCFVLLFHTVNLHNAIWIALNMLQFHMERLVRWFDTNTSFGLKLKEPAWVNWRHRILGALHALSVMTSLVGLVFFFFEYKVGMAFVKHILFSYGSLIQFVGLYGLYFADSYRQNFFNYQGLPAGFSDPPRKKED